MPQNRIQFQKGLSLGEFLRQYGTEARGREALVGWRWPRGFVCAECGHTHHGVVGPRELYQCNRGHHQTSVTSETIFAHTKLPLTTWFLAMYLLTQPKNGISALELKRHLGVSYPTAWSLKHKLMQVMKERDDLMSTGAEGAEGPRRGEARPTRSPSSRRWRLTMTATPSPCA